LLGTLIDVTDQTEVYDKLTYLVYNQEGVDYHQGHAVLQSCSPAVLWSNVLQSGYLEDLKYFIRLPQPFMIFWHLFLRSSAMSDTTCF
jgi:hypothetical protein